MRAPSAIGTKYPALNDKMVHDFAHAMSKLGISKMTTWSQIEMASTVAGFEINEDIFLFLLKAASIFKNMRHIMLNGIKHSKFLSKHASSDKTADVLYEIAELCPVISSTTLREMIDAFTFDKCMFDTQNMVDPQCVDKYELMDEFDKKFPLMFIRFFGRNSKMLCSHDMEFVSWLTSRT